MKKTLSLILSLIMVSMLFVTPVMAADGNYSLTVSTDSIKVGETITVQIDSAEKSIFHDDVIFNYDAEAFEVVEIEDRGGYKDSQVLFQLNYTDGRDEGKSSYTFQDNAGAYRWSFSSRSGEKATTYAASKLAIITLKANKAGNYTFSLKEETAYTDAVSGNSYGFEGISDSAAITVAADAPTAPVVTDGATDANAKTKTWNVAVAADYVTANDNLLATLTNGTDKQEVTLSMGNNVVVGGADWSFSLTAKFNDATKMAGTALSVAKQ